ncbi:MAG: DUF4382 domain-containing protein [Acidobacteria bacterium]|nr:DUF4382 domain-containing protein [Acidobacteriota bacterium]
MANVTVRISDPATCMAPSGPFSHVYVTITDVKAHVSASAGDNDAGWVDLTPALAKAPQQVDLLGLANNQCFLATLGDAQQLQAGNYQQIRVILADNSTGSQLMNNACQGSANCVVTNDGVVSTLELSSEAKTGLKIPSGQIANGGFNIAAGQTKDLDIDFNTCVSIVRQGNGKYRLKPVLHAGEVSTTSSSINGTVVDSATGKQINGQVVVALEQKDATGVDRIFMSTLTNASGQFVFCPLPSGTYDVVIVGVSSTGVVYSPTVVTGVQTGSAMSAVALHALPVVSVGPATIQGTVTSQNTATPAAGTVIDAQLSLLEPVSSTLTVTVPLLPTAGQSSDTLALSTAAGNSCPTGTDCATYSLATSAGPVFAGAFAAGGITVTQVALPASYVVDGFAFVPSSGGTLDCSVSELKSNAVTPVAGATATASTLAFTGCQ